MKKLSLWLLCLSLILALAGCVKTDGSNTLQGLDDANQPAETQVEAPADTDAPVDDTGAPVDDTGSNFNG